MNIPLLGAADSVSTSAFSAVRLSHFPSEEPSVEEVITYLDENEPLVHSTFGFDLRGETPPSLVHLSKQEV